MCDLISRQWLMECVNEGWVKFDTEKDENRFIHLVRDIAPSAQPERKMGKWMVSYLEHEAMGIRPKLLYCSECCQCMAYSTNFCPNCGADMRGEQDG